jgi:FtsZ-interacting cell division protein ZipA
MNKIIIVIGIAALVLILFLIWARRSINNHKNFKGKGTEARLENQI